MEEKKIYKPKKGAITLNEEKDIFPYGDNKKKKAPKKPTTKKKK